MNHRGHLDRATKIFLSIASRSIWDIGYSFRSVIDLLYTAVFQSNKENSPLCFVFPMGIEAHQFIHRVEVRRRWKKRKSNLQGSIFRGGRDY